jgi:hypothetical protein
MSDPNVRGKISQAISLVENGPGKTRSNTNGSSQTPNGTPTASAYAPENAAPALAAINNSAPVAPMQGQQVGANPYQIAALRGGGQGLTPAMMARVAADPTVPQSTKDTMNNLVQPQVVQGPFGTSYLTSMAGALNGAQPRLYANTGQVSNMKLGNNEFPMFNYYNPQTGILNKQFAGPGMTTLNGAAPAAAPATVPPAPSPAPQATPGAAAPITPAAQPPVAPTSAAAPANATRVPPLPGTAGAPPADINTLMNWSNQNEQANERAKAQAKEDADAYTESGAKMNSTQSMLNQLQVYKATMADLRKQGGQAVLGPAEPRFAEITGLLNSLGLTTSKQAKSLADLQELEKTAGQIVVQRLGSVPGLSGHSTDSMRHSIETMTPNPKLSDQGQDKVMDTLENATRIENLYWTKKQQWMSEHGGSQIDNNTGNSFDTEWQNSINGKGSNDPVLKDVGPQKLSNIPMRTITLKNGKKVMQYPSTHPQGFQLETE